MYFDHGDHREIKVGRMLKRAQGKSKVLSATNWKERVFLLTPTSLRYFEGTNEKRGKCKGCVELASVKAVEAVEYETFNRNFCFQVVYDDFYLYVIANDERDRREWIEAVQDECRHNKFLLSTFHPGVFLSKWSCCDGKDKGTQGCRETFVTKERKIAENSASPPSSRLSRPNEPLPPIPIEDPVPKRPEPDPAFEVVVSIYDFEGTEPGDLSLTKGEIFNLVDRSGEHWWLAINSKGVQGYIPSNYVRKQGMESESWFHPEMSRQMSEDNLRKESKEGCFIVRKSSREGMYTLSVLHGDQVRHYHIKKDKEEQFYISDRHRFTTVLELVNYHQHNSGGLVTRLRQPPTFGKAPVTAGFGHDKWELNRAEITLGKELGAGQFGSVYEGIWRNSTSVAVKMIKDGAMSEDDFIQEAKVMKQFQHPHLVQLYGVCSEKPIYIITELMSEGCLLHYLRKSQTRLSSLEMNEMVRQVASAMKYLERHNFIHRDLAARNCLIDANTVVKVGDFGLARFVVDDEYTASEGTKFPIKWASPEVILYSKFSSKSDIWAFGILTWEIYSNGKQPYPAINNTEVVQRILNGYRLERPYKCPEEIYNQIMRICWVETAEQRPTFAQVDAKILEIMGEEYDETTE